jgi:uncharacterized protein YdeI (YjbR/CyaY-like superfamily)
VGAMSDPRFFKAQKEWRVWLDKNHAKTAELLVGFHKTKSAAKGITYKQAVDEALCFGWIDAVRKGGDLTWSIRFTPRKAKSIWSAVNIKRIEELKASGLVEAAGLAAYEGRDLKQQKKYSFENRDAKLDAASEKTFRANKSAWKNFQLMPPSYRHSAIWWVVSAKQDATRERRLAALIADSAAGLRLKHLTSPGKSRALPKRKSP